MAFDTTKMVLIGQGQGNNVYAYFTGDAIATVVGAGYFDGFHGQLREGDLLMVAGSVGGTETADLVVVRASSSSGVTVANGT